MKIFSIKEKIIIFSCEKNNVTLILNVTPILKIASGFSVKSSAWMVEDKKHYSAWINHEIYLTIKFSINVEIFALNLGSWGFKCCPNIKNMFYFIAQSILQTLRFLRNWKLPFLNILNVDEADGLTVLGELDFWWCLNTAFTLAQCGC